MAKARASKGLLFPPASTQNPGAQARAQWLATAISGFVQPSAANKKIYGLLLEILWPAGHGLPGPHVTEKQIREQLDALRAAAGLASYQDVFRRLRELQGDEGFTSIIKEGTSYQLQGMTQGPKREPRQTIPKNEWIRIKQQFGNRCTHCGQQEPAVKLSPDHRVPRSRGGDNSPENMQPLCEQCNNQKSSACQGCDQNCRVCSWAFPEEYKPILLTDENKEQMRREAERKKIGQADLANQILRDHFNKSRG
jgi:hypothetical protein